MRRLTCLWGLALLLPLTPGCSGAGPSTPSSDTPSGPSWDCPGTDGPRAVTLTGPPPAYTSATDGVSYTVQRQYQGALVIIPPVHFDGFRGGTALEDFEMEFVDDGGVLLAERHNLGFRVSCDEDGDTGANWLEVFFDPGTAPGALDGVTGTLVVRAWTIEGEALSDAVQAALVHPSAGGSTR